MFDRSGDDNRYNEMETSRLTLMDPEWPSEASKREAFKAAIAETLKGCGVPIGKINKEELKRRIAIPLRLRRAMMEAMRLKVVDVKGFEKGYLDDDDDEEIGDVPIVVFINPRSGGRQGMVIKAKLLDFLRAEQVLDLTLIKPQDFIQYGLASLEKLAALGDDCANSVRENLRIVVAGGDGTVGWVLGSVGELHLQNRKPVPPTGIIPLGTGNDLSRSFGWGGSFPFAWKSAIKRILYRAATGSVCHLDSWHVTVLAAEGEALELPHALRRMEECPFIQDQNIMGELPENISCFEGVFYNYFSIGMDAQVAYGFHQLRDEKPHLAQNAIANKLIYTGYSCTQGWFLTPCISDPSLRALKNILRISIRRINSFEWEYVPVPSSIRAVVALNLQNYGSGRNPWGELKPEYLEKRGFVEAHPDDGLLEIFGLKQGWHAAFVMVELISAKHIAQDYFAGHRSEFALSHPSSRGWQLLELGCDSVIFNLAAAIRFEIRGGQWNETFLQMDGEPWKQPLNSEHSSFVEIVRVPNRSVMISGE